MDFHLQPLGDFHLQPCQPFVMAGPCSAETEEQVMAAARGVAACGVPVFRAGVWKPRTKPGGFEGIGEVGLRWLQRVKAETGLLVATEVATAHHVQCALEAGIDMVWVGARTTANPFAVQDVADALQGVDIPVFVKNPVNPDIELWIGALERLHQAGVTRLGAIHRGFTTYQKIIYRNMPMWQIAIELMRRVPGLPILCDPSHMGGQRALVKQLCAQAMDLGFGGLMIECHPQPEKAWSDALQQITPEELGTLLPLLHTKGQGNTSSELEKLRSEIDGLDEQLVALLGQRMAVCRAIANYKQSHAMAVVQPERYNEMLQLRGQNGGNLGLDGDFMHQIFCIIHEESVRQQMELIGKSQN